jgi:hypothetical protein
LLICLLSANIPSEYFVSSSCCEDSTELCSVDIDNSSDEDKGCCEDSSCDCLCCHITTFYNTQELTLSKKQTYFIETNFTYEFKYSIDLFEALFRPPLA